MSTAAVLPAPRLLARWRELVWPREHGSWSLALEPVALGLLVAPSAAGACLAGAVLAAFFARRPLRTAVGDATPARCIEALGPLAALVAVAFAAILGVIAVSGVAWMAWLVPAAIAGAAFLYFDLRSEGRAEAAEVAGAAAFAFLPAAFVALAHGGAAKSLAVALLMLGCAVPAVLTVRAALRAAKTGVLRRAPALATSAIALAAAAILARENLAPLAALVLLAILALRTLALLVWPRPAWRARTLGMIEAALGVVFVVTLSGAWLAA